MTYPSVLVCLNHARHSGPRRGQKAEPLHQPPGCTSLPAEQGPAPRPGCARRRVDLCTCKHSRLEGSAAASSFQPALQRGARAPPRQPRRSPVARPGRPARITDSAPRPRHTSPARLASGRRHPSAAFGCRCHRPQRGRGTARPPGQEGPAPRPRPSPALLPPSATARLDRPQPRAQEALSIQ